MKKAICLLTAAALLALSAACTSTPAEDGGGADDARAIVLSDSGVTLDGQVLTEGTEGDVTVSHDIVYYEEGHDDSYGEGTEADAHSAQEAQAHTVVTVRAPGTYRLSGTLSAGQIAVDLGEDAEDDPEAVVTLILDGADVTCTVAPALIFYRVYECDRAWADEESSSAAADVDTSAAGARIVIADTSENTFTGSYVARIYKPGTTSKLHKYDGAFYSKMSMNISGGAEGTGKLTITGDNEGLDSELHLTINGGNLSITAQNDGINTNEDNVSVTTVNGGTLWINAGLGEEGDGIDSNGYLVLNGGTVTAMANPQTGDGGIDASCAILVRGGTVIALGSRNEGVSQDSSQVCLTYNLSLSEGSQVALADESGSTVLSFTAQRNCSSLTLSSPDLKEGGSYTLTVDGQAVTSGASGGGKGGFAGGGQEGFAGGRMDLQVPDGLEEWLENADNVPDDIRAWLEELLDRSQQAMSERPEGQPPEGGLTDRGGQTPPEGTSPAGNEAPVPTEDPAETAAAA